MKTHVGYAHYLRRSEEWSTRAMEDIENLGTIWLTHKPGKMMEQLRGSWPKHSWEPFLKKHPELLKYFEFRDNCWANVTKEGEEILYERDVWGDDWNDRPSYCNSGPPYGGERVEIEAGDLVIIIKNQSSTQTARDEK